MLNKFLRRYTDLPSLIYLLNGRCITLLDPQSWDDQNDSYFLRLYKEQRKLASVLALCFTRSTETYHHWRVFAGGSSGVCISFHRGELLTAVKKQSGVRARPVRYLKLNEIRDDPPAVRDLPFLKRYPFEKGTSSVCSTNHKKRLVRRNRGWNQVRAAFQVSDRGRVRGRGKCGSRTIFS